jgi:transcriptional regulator with XRE-family HTH domain
MGAALTFGGWVTDRPAATGGTASFVRMIGWMAAAGAALTCVGTGGEFSPLSLHRFAHETQLWAPSIAVAESGGIRNPSENLARIREVLRPAVSDLAATLGVSRQSVYNWLNGEPVASENAAKIQDLAEAADALAHEGIAGDASLLKRKISNGRTLLQVAQSGESARDAALLLVQMYRREAIQRERMRARFANRAKTSATSDFDLPAPNDHALG